MTKARTQIVRLMTKRETYFGRPMTPVEIADGLLATMPSIIEALVPDLEWTPIRGSKMISARVGQISYVIMPLSSGRHRIYGIDGDSDGSAETGSMADAITAANAHNRTQAVLTVMGGKTDG